MMIGAQSKVNGQDDAYLRRSTEIGEGSSACGNLTESGGGTYYKNRQFGISLGIGRLDNVEGQT